MIETSWDSGYKPVALKTLEKVLPRRNENQILGKKEKLKVWLDAIDKEVINNFGVFESQKDPEVRFPYTRVLIRNVANSVQDIPASPKEEKAQDKTIVVFTPFIPPPGGGPDDIMNTIYDRVLTALPTLHTKNITVYGLGLPTSKWGSISDEWLNNLKKNGFSEYGKLYAEFLRTFLDGGNILFFAGSMGTVLADQTARQVPEVWKNLKLLLNNPTGVHDLSGREIKLPFVGTIPLSAKGFQVVTGFGLEAGIRMKVPFVDDLVKKSMSGAKPAGKALFSILQQKGIISYESNQQNALKKKCSLQAIKLLMKGNPLDTENFRSYVEQGAFDPATTNRKIRSLMKNDRNHRYFGENRSLRIAVNFTHWMDPGRWPDKWIRRIEQYEKSVKPQTQPIL